MGTRKTNMSIQSLKRKLEKTKKGSKTKNQKKR